MQRGTCHIEIMYLQKNCDVYATEEILQCTTCVNISHLQHTFIARCICSYWRCRREGTLHIEEVLWGAKMGGEPAPTLSPESLSCDRYYTEKNVTYLVYGGYEGIPENLLINVIVWVVSVYTYAFHVTCILKSPVYILVHLDGGPSLLDLPFGGQSLWQEWHEAPPPHSHTPFYETAHLKNYIVTVL